MSGSYNLTIYDKVLEYFVIWTLTVNFFITIINLLKYFIFEKKPVFFKGAAFLGNGKATLESQTAKTWLHRQRAIHFFHGEECPASASWLDSSSWFWLSSTPTHPAKTPPSPSSWLPESSNCLTSSLELSSQKMFYCRFSLFRNSLSTSGECSSSSKLTPAGSTKALPWPDTAPRSPSWPPLLTWWPTQLVVSSCSALHVSVWFTLVFMLKWYFSCLDLNNKLSNENVYSLEDNSIIQKTTALGFKCGNENRSTFLQHHSFLSQTQLKKQVEFQQLYIYVSFPEKRKG